MLQAILEQPEKIVFKEVDRPKAGKGQVVMKVKRVGICGSDIHAYYGKHPYISCPIVMGHEFSAQVVEVGEGVSDIKVGEDITVMPQISCGTCYPCKHGDYHICNTLKVIGCQAEGASQEYFVVDSRLVVKLPEGMSYDYGAMIEPVAVGIHAISRLGDITGKNILVLGAGPIGNLAAQSAKGLGAKKVMITDLSDYRLEVAKKCGIEYCVNTAREDLGEAIHKVFGENGADAILECVGVQTTIEQAIRVARKGTDIIVVGVFGQKPTVDIGLVQDKELRLIGTLMYKEPNYYKAIELIQSGSVVLDPLMTRWFSFKEYQEAYRYIENNRETSMKVIIDMEGK